MLKIYIWSTQYYHPDEPSLGCNSSRYPVWHDALEYAQVMGMETHVGFSTGTVPPSIWLRFPQFRAEDINYTGITLCWQRGKEQILPFQDYLIDTFATLRTALYFGSLIPVLASVPIAKITLKL